VTSTLESFRDELRERLAEAEERCSDYLSESERFRKAHTDKVETLSKAIAEVEAAIKAVSAA
jgi:predicted phage gp36 major capsid-like protein